MSYPDIYLTRPWRRTIMISLGLIFFILAPTLILYTAGYRYNFDTLRVEQTGVISIDANPTDAVVTLSNTTFHKKMPIRLANIAPGRYELSIAKNNFHTWKKDIVVKSNQTTYIRDITLPRIASPEPVQFEGWGDEQNIEAFWPSFDGRYLIIATNKQEIHELFLFDTDRQNLTLLTRTASKSLPIINWAPTETIALIGTETFQGTELRLINLPDTNIIFSATTSVSLASIRYQWFKSALGRTVLLFQDESTLYELTELGKKEIAKVTSTIWFVEDKKRIWTGTSEPTLFLSDDAAILETNFTIPEPATRIVDISPTHFIVQSDNSLMILQRNNNTLTDSKILPINNFQLLPNSHNWIAWSEREIWKIDNQGQSELLNRSGETITSLAAIDKFGWLAVASGQSLVVFNQNYFVFQELWRGFIIETLSVEPKQRRIYFLAKDEKGKKKIYSLLF